MGPHVRTIQKLRTQRSPEIALEVGEAAVRDVLVPLLVEHGLFETPGGICEDATSCNRKLDWELVEPPPKPVDADGQEAAADAAHRRSIIARDDARQVQHGGLTAATTAATLEAETAAATATDRAEHTHEHTHTHTHTCTSYGTRCH